MEYSLLRRRARENLAGMWPLSIAVAAVAYLLGSIGMGFFPSMEWVNEWTIYEVENFRLTIPQGIFGFLSFILGGTLELGYCQFLLKQHDHQDPEFNDLFSQFHRYGTGFAQKFLRGLYVFLWSLLFIIPGIVKGYSYALTPYILTDHPDMTANEAITRSRLMMDGHKGELFVLELTFIGWSILAGLCWNLGYLAYNPYLAAAKAAFYRQLQAQERAEHTTYTEFI